MFIPNLERFKKLYDEGFNFNEVVHDLLKKEVDQGKVLAKQERRNAQRPPKGTRDMSKARQPKPRNQRPAWFLGEDQKK